MPAIANEVCFQIGNIFWHVFGHRWWQERVVFGTYHKAGNVHFLLEIGAVFPVTGKITIPVYAPAKTAARESSVVMVKIGRVQDWLAGPVGFVAVQYFENGEVFPAWARTAGTQNLMFLKQIKILF